MFYDDHNPPHFHAVYGDNNVVIRIADFSVLDGSFPPKAMGMVIEWAVKHQEELLKEWDNMENEMPFFDIDPLE